MARLTIFLQLSMTVVLLILERFSSYEKTGGDGKDCGNRRQRSADSARKIESESRIKTLVEVLLHINDPN